MLAVLTPRGLIAAQELQLIQNVAYFMVIIGIAVFGLALFFAWWYREGNTKAKYLPNWEHGAMTELVWWAIPIEIVLILGAVTWSSTHALDPRKAIEGGDPLIVQVVALEWKWLFIYPEQHIASVNDLHLPVGRPIKFEITADAPMNSFWIPQLGGQIYAMTGMSTELNLRADEAGTYRGGSANYSGEGFADMKFDTVATTEEDFEKWVERVDAYPNTLDEKSFETLAAPAVPAEPSYYGGVDEGMYNAILMQFMPEHDMSAMEHHH